MAVLRPLRVVIDNYPEGQVEEMDAVNNPEDPAAGTRKVPFSRVLYIEQDDFREDPPKQYFRLSPGREVRLRYGYFITCTGVVKDEQGEVVEVHCTLRPGHARRQRAARWPQGEVHHPLGLGRSRRRRRSPPLRQPVLQGEPERGRRGRGFHRQPQSQIARNPDRLQARALPGRRRSAAAATSSSASAISAWIRISAPGKLVFNRTVALRDTWAKIEKRGKAK